MCLLSFVLRCSARVATTRFSWFRATPCLSNFHFSQSQPFSETQLSCECYRFPLFWGGHEDDSDTLCIVPEQKGAASPCGTDHSSLLSSSSSSPSEAATHTQTNRDSGHNAKAISICAVFSLVLVGREGSLSMSVGLQSRTRGSLLRVVSYNPMSLIQSRRALDISEELSADLIGLQGTRSRFVPRPGVGDRYTVRRHQRHWELSWGWQNTRHSNRSAGCSIFVKTRRWRERDLCQVYSTRWFCKEELEVQGCAPVGVTSPC